MKNPRKGKMTKNPFLQDRMKRLREVRGISQKEFASKIGVHPSLISNLESGKRNPSMQTLSKIAKALGVTVSQLFQAKLSIEVEV